MHLGLSVQTPWFYPLGGETAPARGRKAEKTTEQVAALILISLEHLTRGLGFNLEC